MTHNGNSRFNTKYNSLTPGFKQKLGVNDIELEKALVPEIEALGYEAKSGLDKESYYDWPNLQEKWIDKNTREYWHGLRLPDILVGIEDKQALIEVKDQPQMNNWLSTGIRIRAVRRYIAIQHHLQLPLATIYIDNAIQETGKNAKKPLDPYVSAFKTPEGKFYYYGNWLCDLKTCFKSTCLDKADNMDGQDCQIRWKCQEGRNGTEPIMKPFPQILEELKSGKVRKVQGNPDGQEFWMVIQRWSEHFNMPPLEVPEDGLIWFTAK